MSDPPASIPHHSVRGRTSQRRKDARFRAVLTPQRSLSQRGFVILMALIGLVGFVVGMAFLLLGAWPVLGFLGLDVALIYVAFRLNYRQAREWEAVDICPDTVVLTRGAADGTVQHFDFATYWVQVRLDEARKGRHALHLVSHGRPQELGRFLTNDERRELADVLQREVMLARGGPRI